MINTRKREISPRYLSEEERVRIADLDVRVLGYGDRGRIGSRPATSAGTAP